MRLPLPVALLVATLGAPLGACSGATGSAGDAGSTPTTLAIVDGSTLQPLADLTAGQIIHGPQGGYHILVTLLAQGIWPGTPGVPGSPDDPTATLHAYRADTGAEITLMDGQTFIVHVAWDTVVGGYALTDRQLRLDTTQPATLDGATLRLTADVLDKDGHAAHDERRVVARKPAN